MLNNLKLTRVARGITQLDLQIMTGIQQSKISHAEKGVLPLKKEEKQRIEKALKVKIDWSKENSKGGQDKPY
ncbi:MAG: helix-turn-helix transcriptional regulator [Thermodesulfobacteriota bacterium]